MNKKKLIYAQPDCDLFVVRFEGGFLTGTGNITGQGTEKGNSRGGEDESDFIFG